jgi:hypothetical protein
LALLEASLPLGSMVITKASVVTIEPDILVVTIIESSVTVEGGTLDVKMAPDSVLVVTKPDSLVV